MSHLPGRRADGRFAVSIGESTHRHPFRGVPPGAIRSLGSSVGESHSPIRPRQTLGPVLLLRLGQVRAAFRRQAVQERTTGCLDTFEKAAMGQPSDYEAKDALEQSADNWAAAIKLSPIPSLRRTELANRASPFAMEQ